MNQQTTLNLLKSIGAFLAGAIPILQFAYKWFPDQISSLFINQEIIFFTTTITFLLSVFFIFLGISRFSIMFPTFRIDTDPTTGEKYRRKKFIPLRAVATWCIPIFFISAIGFLWIGSTDPSNIKNWLAVIQSALYIITFSLSVFILITFTYDVADRKNSEEIKKDRPRRAINLAKENDAFEAFPRINFYFEKDNFETNQYIVEVYIQDKKYRIVTDPKAETLKAVYPVKEKGDNGA